MINNRYTSQEVVALIYQARGELGIPNSKTVGEDQLEELYGSDRLEEMKSSIREDPKNIAGKGNFESWGRQELGKLMERACSRAGVSIEVGVPLEYVRLVYGKGIDGLLTKVMKEDRKVIQILVWDIKEHGH